MEDLRKGERRIKKSIDSTVEFININKTKKFNS